MNYKILMVVFLLLSGCGEVDKSELKALNGYSTKVEVNKSSKTFTLAPITNATQVVLKDETNKTILAPITDTKPKQVSDRRFNLALKQIQKEKDLREQSNRDFELSLAKVENEHVLMLKSKDIEFSKAEIDGKISMSEIELKKMLESEKTKQLVQNQTHSEALLENKNRYENDKRDALFAKEELEFYKIAAGVIGFLLLMAIFVLYLFKRLREQNKLKISENELSHQMQLKILEHQSQNFDKMLELVSSHKLNENVEKELLSNIKDTHKKTLIFDQKPKRGLIFRK